MTGRARGRSRGRGAPQQNENPAPPGTEAAVRPRAPHAPPGNGSQVTRSNGNGIVSGSGRAVIRGGARRDVCPGDGGSQRQTEETTSRSKRRHELVAVPETKPSVETTKGEAGAKFRVLTNTIQLKQMDARSIYQYSVDFPSGLQNIAIRRRIINEQEMLLGPVRVFDGAILYLGKRLETNPLEFTGQLRDDGSTVPVKITLTCEVKPGSLPYMQILNIVLKKCLRALNFERIGRNDFLPSEKINVPGHDFAIFPGYSTAIHALEGGVQMMIDVDHKVVRQSTVYDLLCEMLRNDRRGNFKEMAIKSVVGKIVLTKYNNKTYRIDDIDFDQTPKSYFSVRGGEEQVTFLDYCLQKYGKAGTISDPNQPLLLSLVKRKDGTESPLLLVPELCIITGVDDATLNNYHVMQDLHKLTRLDPENRYGRVHSFLRMMKSNAEAQNTLDSWGIQLASNLTEIPARRLKIDTIIFNNQEHKLDSDDWSREMRNKRMNKAVSLTNWIIYYPRSNKAEADVAVKSLIDVGRGIGMNISQPKLVPLNDAYVRTYADALRSTIIPDETQMVFCVLSSNKKDLYDTIKKICVCDLHVPSQCILVRTLRRNVMSVCNKVAIQMNCKLGGEVWSFRMPPQKIMVVGIDTYHDSAQRGRSVGAFVATINRDMTRVFSKVCFQAPGQELVSNLAICMRAALRKFSDCNGNHLPDYIIIFRDGVSDGQVEHVHKFELEAFDRCFQEMGTTYCPKMAMIIVTKRINNRFILRQRNGFGNPEAGTIIDSHVTRPQWYDFFLVSQSVRQGTVNPTHYNVIRDTTGLKPDTLQLFTYKMCHLYYNWPGTVRVPAPCLYAHKMAYLTGQSLHRDPHEKMSDKLYYL